jgi:hypothetical protein
MDIKKFLFAIGVVAVLVGAWWAVKALTGGGC